jgi:hypothetical protein
MGPDQRAVIAANNNADLYQAIFSALGLRHKRRIFAFVSEDTPPPYYSHLTVLRPESRRHVVGELRHLSRRFKAALSFKDSFCEFPVGYGGFKLLFEASWLWRPPQAASLPEDWVTLRDPRELAAWEAAWKSARSPSREKVFGAKLLQTSDIVFLGKKDGGNFVSGCIANRSTTCVGISNVFSVTHNEGAFEEAAATVAYMSPTLPIVGYAAGRQLEEARRSRFQTTGPMRVLEANDTSFLFRRFQRR